MGQSLKPLLSDLGGGLLQLERGARAAGALAERVRDALPESLRAHVVGATRRGGDLVVAVDSAAWATRVRYSAPRLRERLAADGEPVTGKVRVRVGRPPAPR